MAIELIIQFISSLGISVHVSAFLLNDSVTVHIPNVISTLASNEYYTFLM